MSTQINPHFFDALVERMNEKGAFEPYDKPLGTTDAKTVDPQGEKGYFRNPSHPGEPSYGNGPAHVAYDTLLPNDLIRAQHQSIRDAINHYLPREELHTFMRDYFSGNFLKSESYQEIVRSVHIHIPHDINTLPNDSLSMQLDHPERCRSDRRMFTEREFYLTRGVCKKVPQIPVAVLAYQAAFCDYLSQLDAAVMRSPALDEEKRTRVHGVLTSMHDLWSNDNIATNFIPAIALHYKKNHPNDTEPPTAKDFQEGLEFLVKNGAFGHRIKHYKGESRTFTCPARQILVDTSRIDLGIMPTAVGDTPEGTTGRALAEISAKAELQMRRGCLGQFTQMFTQSPATQMGNLFEQGGKRL